MLYIRHIAQLTTAIVIGLISASYVLGQNNSQYFEKGTLQLTATDNDGWASLDTYVYKWDDEKRDWNRVADGRTNNGKRNYSLAPGVYRLDMYYREADPREKRVITGIQITDQAVVAKDAYFEKGTLRLTATDNDGWASLDTYVYQWDDEKRDWNRVADGRTNNGKRNYSLAPGVYRLDMYYREADPREKRVITGIQITDQAVVAKDAYFVKGTLRLTATDNDGWASLDTYVYQWDDKKRDWNRVTDGRTNNGKRNYSLASGVYRLDMYYREADPREKRVITGIQITDQAIVEKDAYFEKGTLRLTATDNDGWASLDTYVYQWDDKKRDWNRVTDGRTNNGKRNYSLAPGVYRLDMYYREANPRKKRVIENIRIFDRQAYSIGESFGGNLPPLISTGGPFEVGDGDGYYEVGEKVLFRIDISDSDLDNIEFLINDQIVRRANRPGKFEQILTLSVPGTYKFSVRAKDKTGTLESYGRTIPVNMQKEHTVQTQKYLPTDYGEPVSMLQCPECGNEYKKEFAFCPQDGNKLNKIERAAHAVLDASLVNAGIDPGTQISRHAKKLGLDWLNPFASQAEVDEDIQRLVDDIISE